MPCSKRIDLLPARRRDEPCRRNFVSRRLGLPDKFDTALSTVSTGERRFFDPVRWSATQARFFYSATVSGLIPSRRRRPRAFVGCRFRQACRLRQTAPTRIHLVERRPVQGQIVIEALRQSVAAPPSPDRWYRGRRWSGPSAPPRSIPARRSGSSRRPAPVLARTSPPAPLRAPPPGRSADTPRHRASLRRLHRRGDRPQVDGMRRYELTGAQWEPIAPLLPPQQLRTGPSSEDHRQILNTTLGILRSGAPWADLPARYGVVGTGSSRFHRGRQASRVRPGAAAPAGASRCPTRPRLGPALRGHHGGARPPARRSGAIGG